MGQEEVLLGEIIFCISDRDWMNFIVGGGGELKEINGRMKLFSRFIRGGGIQGRVEGRGKLFEGEYKI